MVDGVLSVIVPVYNEIKTVEKIVSKLVSFQFVKEVIVVDDCSTDGSSGLLMELSKVHDKIKYYRNIKNSGKTYSVKQGILVSTGNIIIIQDADLEYDPSEIHSVISPILNGDADVVYGSRFLVKKTCRVLYYYHYIANKFITFISNLLTNLNMTDIETCYKAFKSDIIKSMTITSSGFGMEVEITAKIAKLKCRIYEVPISYYGRTYENGKKIGFKDGLFALFYVLYYNIFVVKSKSFTQKIEY